MVDVPHGLCMRGLLSTSTNDVLQKPPDKRESSSSNDRTDQNMTGKWLQNKRYYIRAQCGHGTYGTVYECLDYNNAHTRYAIKIARSEPVYAKAAEREAALLFMLQENNGCVKIVDFFNSETGNMCIVEDLMYENLHMYLKKKEVKKLSLNAVALVGTNVLGVLEQLHKNNYIHCDCKPDNVMLPGDWSSERFADAVLIDYGAARKFEENNCWDVQSLCYRAPEVICGSAYTSKIDSWSMGCLLYELATGESFFFGPTASAQLQYAVRTLGSPSKPALESLKRRNLELYEQICEIIEISNGKSTMAIQRINNCILDIHMNRFSDCYPESNGFKRSSKRLCKLFIKLIYSLMNTDETKRLSCSEALQHPFFAFARKESTPDAQCAPLATEPSTNELVPPIMILNAPADCSNSLPQIGESGTECCGLSDTHESSNCLPHVISVADQFSYASERREEPDPAKTNLNKVNKDLPLTAPGVPITQKTHKSSLNLIRSELTENDAMFQKTCHYSGSSSITTTLDSSNTKQENVPRKSHSSCLLEKLRSWVTFSSARLRRSFDTPMQQIDGENTDSSSYMSL